MRSLRELMDLTSRRAIVLGGGGHIGRAVAGSLDELGATLALLDLEEPNAGDAVSLACDLADERSTRQAVRAAIDELGGCDVLVHCAALVGTTDRAGWAVPFEQQQAAVWDEALRVNVTSAFVAAHEARDELARDRRGSIILFGSIYGVVGPVPSLYEGRPLATPAAYAASKGALLQLTRYLATTLAPAVRVNAVSPGGVWRDQPAEFVERYERRTPLRRMATEEDIKGAVAFLAGDLSAYVTGHNLVVDGGWTAW